MKTLCSFCKELSPESRCRRRWHDFCPRCIHDDLLIDAFDPIEDKDPLFEELREKRIEISQLRDEISSLQKSLSILAAKKEG